MGNVFLLFWSSYGRKTVVKHVSSLLTLVDKPQTMKMADIFYVTGDTTETGSYHSE